MVLAVPACGAPLTRDNAPAEAAETTVAQRPERTVTSDSTAVSQRFGTLDEYLAFLESRAVLDGPWYREIRPGIYRYETGNYRGPEVEQRVFTREELERKYGFSR